jgi:hypothetical protein
MDGPGYASLPDKIGGRAHTRRYLTSAIIPETTRMMRIKIKIPTKLFPDALDISAPAQVLFLSMIALGDITCRDQQLGMDSRPPYYLVIFLLRLFRKVALKRVNYRHEGGDIPNAVCARQLANVLRALFVDDLGFLGGHLVSRGLR